MGIWTVSYLIFCEVKLCKFDLLDDFAVPVKKVHEEEEEVPKNERDFDVAPPTHERSHNHRKGTHVHQHVQAVVDQIAQVTHF